MQKNIVKITPFLLALGFVLAACSGPTPVVPSIPPSLAAPTMVQATQTQTPLKPSSTPTIATTATSTPLPIPTENPLHALGQQVNVKGLSLVLIGADYTPSQLQVTFAAKNAGSDEISANFIDFSAYGADGTKLKTDACFTALNKSQPDYAVPSFGGSLQPGENLRGTICWKSADPKGGPPVAQTGIRVSYTPEGTAKPASIWDVSSAGKVDAPVELAKSDFVSPPNKQGEGVTLKDVTVTFDGVTFQGVGQDKTRVVMAHFTFENKGANSYKFGDFLSYSFAMKLADGSPLSTDFTTVGCQNTASKVEISPAQKRSLTLCFVDPGTSSLAPGSLAIFIPKPGEGEKVFWVTE